MRSVNVLSVVILALAGVILSAQPEPGPPPRVVVTLPEWQEAPVQWLYVWVDGEYSYRIGVDNDAALHEQMRYAASHRHASHFAVYNKVRWTWTDAAGVAVPAAREDKRFPVQLSLKVGGTTIPGR